MKKSIFIAGSVVIALTMMSTFVSVAFADRIVDHIYKFEIGPGSAHWTVSSTLQDDVWGSATGTGHVDKFVMRVIGVESITVRIQVADCCVMGDTIALGKAGRYVSATSPDTIDVFHVFAPGTYTFYVGFILPNNGLFPAGYDITVDYWFP